MGTNSKMLAKIGTMGLGMISFVVLSSCAKKQNATPQPPPPCTVGVNQESCQLPVMDQSNWIRKYDVTKADTVSGKDVVVKQVTVIQSFRRDVDGSQTWRRTSTVTDQGTHSSKTMMIHGRVLYVTKKRIHLTIDGSSCDGIDNSFKIEPGLDADGGRDLYYQRDGDNLDLRLQPFPQPVKYNSTGNPIGDLFGQIIVQTIGTVIQRSFQVMVGDVSHLMIEVATFGLYRDQLTAGEGSYSLIHPEQLLTTYKNFSFGQIGCFMPDTNSAKNKFIPAKSLQRGF